MTEYNTYRFWSTHNSYEAKVGGLIDQLQSGVRCLEFDIHSDDFAAQGFRLGHNFPGHLVSLGLQAGVLAENPTTPRLVEWLEKFRAWSNDNRAHAPITLILDLKSDLTLSTPGGLGDLNHALGPILDRLFTRDEFQAQGAVWPDVSLLRGRFLAVLSGNGTSRRAYRYPSGSSPAIGANASGQVAVVFRDRASDLCVYSGILDAGTRRVAWRHNQRLMKSGDYLVSEPSVSVCDDGRVLLVWRDGPQRNGLDSSLISCRVGRFDADGRIVWGPKAPAGSGREPVARARGDVLYLHFRNGGANFVKTGGFSGPESVSWNAPGPDVSRPDPTSVVSGAVSLKTDLANGIVRCTVNGLGLAVQHEQLAFVEFQGDETFADFVDPVFYAAPATAKSRILGAPLRVVSRAYYFKHWDAAAYDGLEAPNMPATDYPKEAWYKTFMASNAGLETIV